MIKNVTFGKYGKYSEEDCEYKLPVTVNGEEGFVTILAVNNAVHMNMNDKKVFTFSRADWHDIMNLWRDAMNNNCKIMIETEEVSMILKKTVIKNILLSYEYYTLHMISKDREKVCVDIHEDIIETIVKIGRWI